KPYKIAELKMTVTRALEFYELRQENLCLREYKTAASEILPFTEIGTALAPQRDMASLLDNIAKSVCQYFGYRACAIELIDKDNAELYTQTCYGFATTDKHRSLVAHDSISEVARTGKMVRIADVTKDDRYTGNDTAVRSQLAIAIRTGEEVLGVLNIESDRPDDFSERELLILCSFADKAAAIVQQARLFVVLSRGKAEWESTFDAMADAIFIFDLNRRLRRINRAGARLLERSYDQLLGQTCCTLFPDEQRTSCLAQRLYTQGQRIVEKQLFGSKQVPMIITADAIYHVEETIGCVITLRDQSELYRIEAESSTQRNFLANLVENAFDAIMVLDCEGRLTWVNSRLIELVGSNEVKLNSHIFEIFIPEEYREEVRTAFQDTLSGEPQIFNTALITATGDLRYLTITTSPIHTGDQVTDVLAIARDITEHKRAIERSAESEKLRTLGQLACGVAHDFNNILAAILGRAQLMQIRVDNADLLRNLQVIERAARDGARMAQRIRDFARPREYTKEHFGIIRLDELIREAVDVTAPRWKDEAHRSGRHIRIEFEPSQQVFVQGDASALREVLTNLILNSVDALPTGGKIKFAYGQHQNIAYISVQDNGIGIPKEVQNHIFEPFFTTKGERGTGLGLNVSQSIIMEHGGFIEVESEVAKGTTVRISLPLLKQTEIHPKNETLAMPTPTEMQLTPTSRILIVDDEEDVRDLLADILSSFGHEVVIAESGVDALEVLATNRFQLVVTDLGMPEMSGSELAERAKALYPGLPVILCTGWGEAMDKTQIKDGIIDLIISKPFDLEQIYSALAQILCTQP
ncbi:MAG: ATP-binding protein, partial [Acidobacteriota bacterium]